MDLTKYVGEFCWGNFSTPKRFQRELSTVNEIKMITRSLKMLEVFLKLRKNNLVMQEFWAAKR